jgi:hypothetical protein
MYAFFLFLTSTFMYMGGHGRVGDGHKKKKNYQYNSEVWAEADCDMTCWEAAQRLQRWITENFSKKVTIIYYKELAENSAFICTMIACETDN